MNLEELIAKVEPMPPVLGRSEVQAWLSAGGRSELIRRRAQLGMRPKELFHDDTAAAAASRMLERGRCDTHCVPGYSTLVRTLRGYTGVGAAPERAPSIRALLDGVLAAPDEVSARLVLRTWHNANANVLYKLRKRVFRSRGKFLGPACYYMEKRGGEQLEFSKLIFALRCYVQLEVLVENEPSLYPATT